MTEAVGLAERAIELDPEFARAHALLGHALLIRRFTTARLSTDDPAVLLRRAETAIFRALSLDPDLSDAHLAYATFLREAEKPGAEDEYKRALELNPNNAAAWHDYGVYLANNARRFEESREANRRSVELDPRSAVTWANYLEHLRQAGDPGFDAALEKAIALLEDIDGGLAGLRISILQQGTGPQDERLDQRMEKFASQRGGLDSSSIEAFLAGQPVTAMKMALAVERGAGPKNLPTWITRSRAWSMVDLEVAERVIQSPVFGTARPIIPDEHLRLWFMMDIAGLRGDQERFAAALAELEAAYGPTHAGLNASKAFWLSVQGRLEEAAGALALAEPIPDSEVPYRMGGSVDWGQMLPAQLRIYRATGREREAQELAASHFERLRKLLAEPGPAAEKPWPALAGLAASEGRREEAVAALREAMAQSPVPFDFWPQLPWFTSLQGYPPYDEILRERARRAAEARTELERLDPTN